MASVNKLSASFASRVNATIPLFQLKKGSAEPPQAPPPVYAPAVSPYMNCTVLSFSTVPFRADVGDLYEANDSQLVTSCS